MKTLRRIFSPFSVIAQWGALVCVHRAMSHAEALEWAAQYPADAFIVVTRFGRVVGLRSQA